MKKRNLFLAIVMIAIVSLFTACSEEKKDEPTTPPPTTDTRPTITDNEGNVYHTVTIGTQTWMVENLRTTKYNDGTAIPNVTDNTAWSNLTTGAWCNYENSTSYDAKYGKLYNWWAVNTGKLAPTGWHVPTSAEWSILEDYVAANPGISGSESKALAATTDWSTSSSFGAIGNDLSKNNSSGFSALPGGYRYESGTFSDFGLYGFWWSTDVNSTYYAWGKNLGYFIAYLNTGDYDLKGEGRSVRCVKD